MNNKYMKPIPFERVVFHKEQVGFSTRVSRKDGLQGWMFDKYEEQAINELVYRVTNFMAYGYKEALEDADVPVTWVDHLKLDINVWATKYLRTPHFFFTNIAKAINQLRLKPRFRKIVTKTNIKNYCPHFNNNNSQDHVEFMQIKPFDVNTWGGFHERLK